MKFSIITVVYNSVNCIGATIENVLESFSEGLDYEYIIIDGGSTDGTCRIIETYLDRLSYFISEPDSGIYDAMNKGVKLATGDWIVFMNCGDYFYSPDSIAFRDILLGFSDLRSYQIVYGHTIVKQSGDVIKIDQEYVRPSFFMFNTICHQSVFFNNSVFEKVGLFDLRYKIIADKALLFRVAQLGGKFYNLNQIVSVWDEVGYSTHNLLNYHEEDRLFKKINFNPLHILYARIMLKFLDIFKSIFRHMVICVL